MPKAAAKSRGAGSAAAAGSSGGVIDGTDNDMSPAQQWAMLTEDCDVLHAYIDDDEGGIHQLVPEVFHTEVDEKRIVEGNLGEHANLQRSMADDIINDDEQVTSINIVKYAMLIQDSDITYHIFGSSIYPVVDAKRIWLLEGPLKNAELISWPGQKPFSSTTSASSLGYTPRSLW